MNKRTRSIPAVLVVSGTLALVMSDSDTAAPRCAVLRAPSGQSLRVELARDPATRARGLSDRAALETDGLLLEWPDAGRHPVWMAGMQFSLDLIWLDDADRVTGVVAHVPLCQGPPCPLVEPASAKSTRSVLEVVAGRASDLKLVPGAALSRVEATVPCVPEASPFTANSSLEGGLP